MYVEETLHHSICGSGTVDARDGAKIRLAQWNGTGCSGLEQPETLKIDIGNLPPANRIEKT